MRVSPTDFGEHVAGLGHRIGLDFAVTFGAPVVISNINSHFAPFSRGFFPWRVLNLAFSEVAGG